MFMCEIWLFVWYFPQFCTSDMSKYGYLEVFQRVPSTSRERESTVHLLFLMMNKNVANNSDQTSEVQSGHSYLDLAST